MTQPFDDPGLAEVVQLVRAVARTEIMPRFRRLAAGDVSIKSGPQDLVTVADEAAEARLTAGLHRLFPGCAVVGEEAATREPAVLRHVDQADTCFVVDPVDGTWNFAAGLPLFGIIVARIQRGRITGAVIHDPVGDDTAVAAAGQGAWMLSPAGANRLQTAAPVPLAELSGVVSWRYMPPDLRAQVCGRLPRLGSLWDYRCAAHQYRSLAAGFGHVAVYYRTLPWDHAAGVLLHQEAGGHVARPDGSAYDPAQSDAGLICAPDPASWQAVKDALFG